MIQDKLPDPNEPIFIGMEDGVAVYVSRKNISGVDREMQRDHQTREFNHRAAQAWHDLKKKGLVE